MTKPDEYNEIFTRSKRQDLEYTRQREAERRSEAWKRNLITVIVIALIAAAIWLMKG